jgi:hypothetical protein
MIDRVGPRLDIPEAQRPRLLELLRVSQPLPPRALASRQGRRTQVWFKERNGRLRCRYAFTKGRRTLPPVGTSDWGRAMLAKRGGLARQRQCRELGIHPTAEATRARRVPCAPV